MARHGQFFAVGEDGLLATSEDGPFWTLRSSRCQNPLWAVIEADGQILAVGNNETTAELDRSLQRLRTDHFDLYQLHAVTQLEDVETIFGPAGAMEAFEKARKDGKVRFLRFSAHSVEAALALMDRFRSLKLAAQFTPLTPEEVEVMKRKGLAASPLFRYSVID